MGVFTQPGGITEWTLCRQIGLSITWFRRLRHCVYSIRNGWFAAFLRVTAL